MKRHSFFISSIKFPFPYRKGKILFSNASQKSNLKTLFFFPPVKKIFNFAKQTTRNQQTSYRKKLCYDIVIFRKWKNSASKNFFRDRKFRYYLNLRLINQTFFYFSFLIFMTILDFKDYPFSLRSLSLSKFIANSKLQSRDENVFSKSSLRSLKMPWSHLVRTDSAVYLLTPLIQATVC